MKLSVVMPVYNECWTIREIVRRVMAQAPLVSELVIVDDGSTDGTRGLIGGLLERYKDGPVRIRAIMRKRNGGKGCALKEGFAAATGDLILIQDGDLEYDPRDYAELVEPLLKGQADAVFGSRFLGARRNVLMFWHTLANKLLTLCVNVVADRNFTDVWTGYKVFRAELVRRIPIVSRGFDIEPEITIKLAKLGCRVVEVPIRYQGRGYAEGKKIGLMDAFIAVWTIAKTWIAGGLGEFSAGERTLRIIGKAGRYNRFIYDQFRARLGDEVVEIGAGVGNVSRFLLDRRRLVLTEADPSFLATLRATFEGWEGVEVRPLDVVEPRGVEELWGRFDTAICFNVVEHVKDEARAVANTARLLKPGGAAVFMVPAHQWLFGSLDSMIGHVKRYERAEFCELATAAGLEIVEARYLNPLAIAGWLLNGRILRRKMIPGLQLALFDRMTWLTRALSSLGLPFGLSLFVVARRKS
jgi:glycosyltransferase involved in cell wall biosynthesis